MKQQHECASPGKLKVISAEWLSPGFVFALSKGGGFQITDTKVGNGNPIDRAQRIISTIDTMSREPNCSAVFLTKEDCALVSEFFPDALTRQDVPPGQDKF
jgi:hypothetical protein